MVLKLADALRMSRSQLEEEIQRGTSLAKLFSEHSLYKDQKSRLNTALESLPGYAESAIDNGMSLAAIIKMRLEELITSPGREGTQSESKTQQKQA